MLEDYEKQAWILHKDPLVWSVVQILKDNRRAGNPPRLGIARTPLLALGWKRTTLFRMYDLLAKGRAQPVVVECLDILRSATVVYLGQAILPVFRTLASKAMETLEAIPEGQRPVLPPLPFESIFLVEAEPARVNLLSQVNGAFSAIILEGEEGAEVLTTRPVSEASYLALHTLLTEKVGALHEERPNRQFRKQARAAGLPDESVHVLYLRPVQHEKGVAGDGGSGTAYHSRWAVRGHWRNHWFSSTQEHRLLWIDPHIKGPESAPFKETVRAVVR